MKTLFYRVLTFLSWNINIGRRYFWCGCYYTNNGARYMACETHYKQLKKQA